jgi:hypothetical protein
MAKLKYAKCLVQKPGPFPLELQGKDGDKTKDPVPGVKTTHLMTAGESAFKGPFSVDCTWLWSGAAKGPVGEPHTHDFSQVIGIIGGHPDDPHDLGGEITVWLDGRKEVFTHSALIFVPAGVVHGPFLFSKINRRVFFLTLAMTGKYTRKSVAQVARPSQKKPYSVVDRNTKWPPVGSGKPVPPPPPPGKSTSKGGRILHMEDDIVPGSFYVDVIWIWSGTGGAPAPEHTHDWPELLAMAGADPAHPHDLGGEMSVFLGDEYHATTKSSLVCVPAGLKHCPWEFRDIKKHALIFSAGPRGIYSGSHKKD